MLFGLLDGGRFGFSEPQDATADGECCAECWDAEQCERAEIEPCVAIAFVYGEQRLEMRLDAGCLRGFGQFIIGLKICSGVRVGVEKEVEIDAVAGCRRGILTDWAGAAE